MSVDVLWVCDPNHKDGIKELVLEAVPINVGKNILKNVQRPVIFLTYLMVGTANDFQIFYCM